MKKQKDFKKTMKSIFDGILSGVAKETLEKYPELIKGLANSKNSDDFNMMFMYQIRKCVDQVIVSKLDIIKCPSPTLAQSRISFLYLNYDFVKSHIEGVIKPLESWPCSADKSRYIINAYEKYFMEGIPLGLPRDEKRDKDCFWKPKFWNDEIWIEYLDVLISLYYGNFIRYGTFMKDSYLPLTTKLKKEKGKK